MKISPEMAKVYETARNGKNETLICKVSSGFLLMGFQQFLPGYVILFADPMVGSLNDLNDKGRVQFLTNMAMIGDVLLSVTSAERINYEILGNASPILHCHMFPRYPSEAKSYKNGPVWRYPKDIFNGVMFDNNRVDHIELKQRIKKGIESRMSSVDERVD